MSDSEIVMAFPVKGHDLDEMLAVVHLTGDQYRIGNIPFLAGEVSLGDVVRGKRQPDGSLLFDGTIKAFGSTSVAIKFIDPTAKREVVEFFAGTPCVAEERGPDLMAVSVNPSQKSGIASRLTEFEDAGRLVFAMT